MKISKTIFKLQSGTAIYSLERLHVLVVSVSSSPEPSGSQGELIVYPCSVVRRRPFVHNVETSPLKPLGKTKPNVMILKLGMQHQGLKRYKGYINDGPRLTLSYLLQGQIGSPIRLNGGNLSQSHLMG